MMQSTVAPPLPEKSKLRKSPTTSTLTSSEHPTTTTTTTVTAKSVDKKQKQRPYKSRFEEQFDHVPPPELLEALADTDFHVSITRKPQRQNNKPSLRPFLHGKNNSTSTIDTWNGGGLPSPSSSTPLAIEGRPPLSNSAFWSSSSLYRSFSSRNLKGRNNSSSIITSDDEFGPTQSTRFLPPLSDSHDEDGPLQGYKSENESNTKKKKSSRLFGRSKSISSSEHHEHNNGKNPRMPTIFSLNRAEVIIARLQQWHHLLKAVTNWLEEVAKISFQSSRCYSHRALPWVKGNSGRDDDDDGPDAMNTMRAGLQMLTMQLANEQKEFGRKIQHDFIPALFRLRKECKEMIRGLKEEPDLVMDELLRRAETTRKSMATLNKYCKAAEAAAASGQAVEHDPWLANLYVLRQLKREVDEENRMRELMVPIQKGTAAFEARVLEHIKPAIAYCYRRLAPGLWNGTADTETAAFKLVIDQLMPDHEWQRFYESKKKDLVDEQNPKKDYLKINYPNKMSPHVMTLAKGVLERRIGVRRQYTERYYVLSQCGYLHQFTLDNKVSPERSIYIPDTTVVFSIDTEQVDQPNSSLTFEIHRRGNQVLQRDKVYAFRASSREELLSWCTLLRDVSARFNGGRIGPISRPLPVQQPQAIQQFLDSSSSTHGSSSSSVQEQDEAIAITCTGNNNNNKYPLSRAPSQHSTPSVISIPTVRAPSVVHTPTSIAPELDDETASNKTARAVEKCSEEPQTAPSTADDAESSVYFSSASAPPSPSSSSVASLSGPSPLEDIPLPALESSTSRTPSHCYKPMLSNEIVLENNAKPPLVGKDLD